MRFIDGNDVDWYILSEPVPNKDSTISMTVTCPHLSTLLKTKNIYLEFDDENGIGTIQDLAAKILAGTGWSIGRCETMLERDGVTEKVRSLKSNNKDGAYALITKLCSLFNAYPEYHGDTKKVDFFALNDLNTEWEMTVGRNLNGIKANYNSSSIVTRLYVEGEYSDFGYVGIDDVNPTGLSYILNFDYYRDLGLFTAEHEAALTQYLSDVADKKAEISAAQTALIAATNKVVTAVGYTPFTVYTLKAGDNNDKVIDKTYRVNGATATPGTGDDMIGIIDDTEYEHFENPQDGSYSTDYTYLIYFERLALGQIGVDESAIEAKEQQVEAWQKKIDATTDPERISEYEAYIAILEAEILAIYEGGQDTDGLYERMYDLALDGIDVVTKQAAVDTGVEELEELEAVFTAAMGEMLRDGRWTDENYAVGQEESLYLDALDMSERCAKPKVTYSLTYLSAKEALGHGIEDIRTNSIGHIWDEELNINDYGYIKSVTIVHDNEQMSKIEVTTDDGFSKQVTLESVLTRIAEMAEIIKAKNSLFDRAGAIQSNGQIAADRLSGVIDVLKNQLSSVLSNWYTDDHGNLIFESVNGNGAMMLCGEGFMIASERNLDGTWNYRTLGTGNGICADEITTGFLSAERILAGSVTADKIVGTYGQTIDLSGNAIQQTIRDAQTNAEINSATYVDQTAEAWSVTAQQTYANKADTEQSLSDLAGRATTVEKYLTFGNDYLVIGTSGNDFNVQITNNAINFRKGQTVLAYMNNQRLYIAESEVTNQLRIGNYLWVLPQNNGAAAIIYMPV